jgi:DNA-binding CsgD family transcriptional regulator
MTVGVAEGVQQPQKRRARRGPYRTKVTEKEREVYDLRQQGLPWAEIARRLGRDYRTVMRTYERAERKIPKEGQLEAPPGSTQREDPEKYAAFVNELIQPGTEGGEVAVAAIAKRLNLPQRTASTLAQEIRSIYFPTAIEARNVKLERLKDLWGMRAEEALAQLTPERVANASPRDLAIIAGIATEKVLLLRGQPTQIVRSEDNRLKIGELAQAFVAEAARRGHEVELTAETREVSLTYKGQGRVGASPIPVVDVTSVEETNAQT